MAGGGDESEVARLRAENAALTARAAELEQRVDDMFARNAAVKLMIDPANGAIVDANPAAAAYYGYTRDELRRMRIHDLNQLPLELIEREMARAREEQRNYFEFKHRLRSGEVRDVQVYTGPCDVGGRRLLFSIICDITERNRLAAEVAHGQRMEALGRLAGGVAHDFNNLLTTVEMLASAIGRNAARGRDVAGEVGELKGLVARGAALTRQLLAFCRRQVMRPVLVDLAEVVTGMERMVTRLCGEGVALTLRVEARPAPVIGDATQLEQVVLNLVMNARDAMPRGGKLTIAVDADELTPARAAPLGLHHGSYLCLTVTDTGEGIRPEEQPHVFEPFFTTKTAGQGTGLGLATVYGIVRQASGTITLESVTGRGTTFRVWLPRAEDATVVESPVERGTPRAIPATGGATILLAEDEGAMRRMLRGVLEAAGFRVVEACDGDEGLAAARAHDGPIDLLVTDVVMPKTGGRALAEALVRDRPDVRVLYISGYVDLPAVDHGLLDAAESFLAKPFTAEALVTKVRDVLAGPIRRAALGPGGRR